MLGGLVSTGVDPRFNWLLCGERMRKGRLELPRPVRPLAPEASASTNSATSAGVLQSVNASWRVDIPGLYDGMDGLSTESRGGSAIIARRWGINHYRFNVCNQKEIGRYGRLGDLTVFTDRRIGVASPHPDTGSLCATRNIGSRRVSNNSQFGIPLSPVSPHLLFLTRRACEIIASLPVTDRRRSHCRGGGCVSRRRCGR